MKSIIGTTLLASFVFAAFLLGPRPGHALTDWGSPQISCYKWSDGSGMCWGTYAGFRADPDTNTYVQASTSAYTSFTASYFYSSYRGLYGSCYIPNGREPLVSQIARLASHRGEFTVAWDAQGYCTQVSLQHGSGYTW